MTETSENPKSYENLFAGRFSAGDPVYQQYVTRPADPPPIVEDWRARVSGNQRSRDNRYQDHRRDREPGWGGHRGWRGDHHGQQRWHDGDTRWGHGSGYNSNQGYNAHHQRSHYDRY